MNSSEDLVVPRRLFHESLSVFSSLELNSRSLNFPRSSGTCAVEVSRLPFDLDMDREAHLRHDMENLYIKIIVKMMKAV